MDRIARRSISAWERTGSIVVLTNTVMAFAYQSRKCVCFLKRSDTSLIVYGLLDIAPGFVSNKSLSISARLIYHAINKTQSDTRP